MREILTPYGYSKVRNTSLRFLWSRTGPHTVPPLLDGDKQGHWNENISLGWGHWLIFSSSFVPAFSRVAWRGWGDFLWLVQCDNKWPDICSMLNSVIICILTTPYRHGKILQHSEKFCNTRKNFTTILHTKMSTALRLNFCHLLHLPLLELQPEDLLKRNLVCWQRRPIPWGIPVICCTFIELHATI